MNGGNSDDLLRIKILDVGQGDAIIVVLPGGRRALVVDAYDGLRVSEALEDEGIQEVVLFLSHSDTDHVRGVGDLIGNLESTGAKFLALFYNADRLNKTAASQYVSNLRCLACATRSSAPTWSKDFDTGLNHDRRFEGVAGELVTLEVLHPTHDERMSLLGASTNEASGVLRVACVCRDDVEASMLLTGDAQLTGISCMIHNHAGAPEMLRADVLKFPHHGAWPRSYPGWSQFTDGRAKAGMDDFLEAVDPMGVVLSVGRDNGDRHVKREVFDAVCRRCAKGGRIARIVCTELTDTCLTDAAGCRATACAGDVEIKMGPAVTGGIEIVPAQDEHRATILSSTDRKTAGCGPLLT